MNRNPLFVMGAILLKDQWYVYRHSVKNTKVSAVGKSCPGFTVKLLNVDLCLLASWEGIYCRHAVFAVYHGSN